MCEVFYILGNWLKVLGLYDKVLNSLFFGSVMLVFTE